MSAETKLMDKGFVKSLLSRGCIFVEFQKLSHRKVLRIGLVTEIQVSYKEMLVDFVHADTKAGQGLFALNFAHEQLTLHESNAIEAHFSSEQSTHFGFYKLCPLIADYLKTKEGIERFRMLLNLSEMDIVFRCRGRKGKGFSISGKLLEIIAREQKMLALST